MRVCKVPCNDCPFTKTSIPGWLGEYESPEQLHLLVMSERPFPCHLTHTEETLDFKEAGNDNHPLCAGSLAYMKKLGKLPRNKQLKRAIDNIDKNILSNILAMGEFLTHHKKFKK